MKKFLQYRLLTIAIGILCLFSLAPAVAQGIVLDRIIATVNEEAITEVMFKLALSQELEVAKQSASSPKDEETLKIVIAKRLLDNALLNSEARILNIKVSAAEITAEIDSIKEKNNFDEIAFDNFLAAANFTLSQFKSNLSDQIKRTRLIDNFVRYRINMDEENIFEYYNQNFANPDLRYKSRAYSIMLPENYTPQQKELALEKMATYRYQVTRGELQEGKLQQIFGAHSDMEFKSFNMLKSELIIEFQQALFGLAPGTFSVPFITSFGVHMVELIDITLEEPRSYEQMKEDVYSSYYRSEFNRHYENYLTELHQKYAVDYKDQQFADYIKSYKENIQKYSQFR